MRKPRPFSHSPIYMDARRERLADIERRARQELGQTTDVPSRPLSFREPSRRSRFSNGQLLFLVVVLVLVCWFLMYHL